MSSSRRNSEVDFRDVFGGPPRRCSIHEFYNDGKHSFDSADDVEAEGLRFGLGQKPVFGDEVGTRRRYPSEDFFDDIFGGDQPSSCSQSPRSVPRRDPFSSAPGSRVMSPSRPLPPMVEPSASPTKFSLPTRLANADFLASTPVDQSLSSAMPSMSRYNQTSQNHDVLRADVRLSYRPSPLSYQNSVDGKESVSNKMLDGSVEGSNYTKEDSKGSEVPIDSTQFHFSIYKWAGKGVPLVMSLRKRSPSKSKERTKIERCLSSRFVNDSLDSNTNEMPSPSRVKDREHCQSFDDINQTISEFVSCGSLQNVKQQVCEDEIPREVPNLSKNNSSKSPGKTRKSNVRPLSSFFQEQENGNKTILAERGGKETVIKEKGQPSLDDVVSSRKINKNKVPQSFREAKDDWNKKDDTRKVKEFVEILNQESSSKPTTNISGQNQSLRWNNDKTMFEAKNEAKPISTQKHNEMRASKVKPSKTLPEASNVIDGNSFLPGKQKDHVKNNGSVLETPSQASTNEQSVDGLADFATNIDPTLDNDIMSKELLQEIDITSEVEYQEETQAYERKIRNWSRGKEGNIRALLSTLQYVLWPNSGWKPVPLVDIIEANAVKRAYQKALLRLHPDKLQQKGAAAHQKFIAQQVFDILQEAWDHFNTLGTL